MKRSLILALSLGTLLPAARSMAQSPRLIGWWRMDEADGATTLADASGNGRNATLGAGVTIVDGRFGKAARFDGTTAAWAQFSQPALSNLTIAAWVYMDGIPTNIFPRIMQLAGEFYYHMPSNNVGSFTFGKSGTGSFDWGSNNQLPFRFTTNAWFHAAVVVQQQYTSETERVFWPTFYVNGVRCSDPGLKRAFISIPSGNAFIGNNSSGGGGIRPLNGMLDDVRLYDAPLSDRDILHLYQHRPLAVDAGADQTVHRDATVLQGRLASTNSFMDVLSAAVTWSVLSVPEGATPLLATPHVPVTAVTLPEPGTYTFRLTAVTELGTVSDDLTVTRLATPPVGNAAPSVTPAWTSTNIVLGADVALAANVSDDAQPGPLRLRWSKTGGPGAVFFDNPFANATTTTFSTNGTYTLQLEADDGATATAASVTVNVSLPASDLSDGLAHWWRMDDDPALKTAADSAGANTLTFARQAFLQPGKTGHGFRAPLTNAYAQAASLPPQAETMTFTAWFYHDDAYVNRANNNIYQRLYNCGPNFYIIFNPATTELSLSTTDTGGTSRTWSLAAGTLSLNRWHHLAVLFDRRAMDSGSRQTVYVDGRRYLTGTLSVAFTGAAAFTSPFIVGNAGSHQSVTRNFDGVLDELRVYSRFLTQEEVLRLAADPAKNRAPVIEGVPATLSVKITRTAALGATVTDDARPAAGTLATLWRVVSGDPAHVHLSDPADPAAIATFSRTGDYALVLDASDGELAAAARVDISVLPVGTLIRLQ